MADKRPKRQRKERLATEFFRAGLLHKEEVELRRALHASLKKARTAYQRTQEKPHESVSLSWNTRVSKHEEVKSAESATTKSVCTGTNTRFRIKSSARKRFEKSSREYRDYLEKKDVERKESQISGDTGWVSTTPLKRKGDDNANSCLVKKKDSERRGKATLQRSGNTASTKLQKGKGGEIISDKEKGKRKTKKSSEEEAGESVTKEDLENPLKTVKVSKSLWEREPTLLPKSKLTLRRSFNNRKVKGYRKSKVVQSLTEKFSANEKDEKQLLTLRKKGSEGINGVEFGSEKISKKTYLKMNEIGKVEQNCGPSEESSKVDSSCESRQHASNLLQGTARRRLKHKFKDRKLVNPLGEIYIPANVAKTEDFLTFLCLRGNSSLPKSFEVFNNPDPFFTQPSDQSPGDATMLFPAFPIQSSVVYSPPSSRAPTPSESSAASPMSSNDGWAVNDV